jgi:hypothetical protein
MNLCITTVQAIDCFTERHQLRVLAAMIERYGRTLLLLPLLQ